MFRTFVAASLAAEFTASAKLTGEVPTISIFLYVPDILAPLLRIAAAYQGQWRKDLPAGKGEGSLPFSTGQIVMDWCSVFGDRLLPRVALCDLGFRGSGSRHRPPLTAAEGRGRNGYPAGSRRSPAEPRPLPEPVARRSARALPREKRFRLLCERTSPWKRTIDLRGRLSCTRATRTFPGVECRGARCSERPGPPGRFASRDSPERRWRPS